LLFEQLHLTTPRLFSPTPPPLLCFASSFQFRVVRHCKAFSSLLPLLDRVRGCLSSSICAASSFFLHLLWPYTSPNQHHRANVSCILSSHLHNRGRLRASLQSLSSTSALTQPPTMSFNITSDGSPTPRKGVSRFCRTAGDLHIDTSPELLGQAVGGFSQNHYPFALYRGFGSSLTANMQGAKRPLGVSTLGNQNMVAPQQNAFEGYKVS
jgi:hypothetical protein